MTNIRISDGVFSISEEDEENIQKLDCSYNQLSSLPPEIGNLENLRVLICFNNQLSSLPLEIGNLSNLRELYCSDNQLPPSFDLKKIRTLAKIRRFMAGIILSRFLENLYINYKYNPDLNMEKIKEMRESEMWS